MIDDHTSSPEFKNSKYIYPIKLNQKINNFFQVHDRVFYAK